MTVIQLRTEIVELMRSDGYGYVSTRTRKPLSKSAVEAVYTILTENDPDVPIEKVGFDDPSIGEARYFTLKYLNTRSYIDEMRAPYDACTPFRRSELEGLLEALHDALDG